MPKRIPNKPRRGSIQSLTVNLRCELCNALFEWKPRWLAHIEQRIPGCCSGKCAGRLQQWRRERQQFNTQRE